MCEIHGKSEACGHTMRSLVMCIHIYMYTHTHTHTSWYIYIYIYIRSGEDGLFEHGDGVRDQHAAQSSYKCDTIYIYRVYRWHVWNSPRRTAPASAEEEKWSVCCCSPSSPTCVCVLSPLKLSVDKSSRSYDLKKHVCVCMWYVIMLEDHWQCSELWPKSHHQFAVAWCAYTNAH